MKVRVRKRWLDVIRRPKEMTEDEGVGMSEDERSALLNSCRPIKVFDEETGIPVPFIQMNCCVCKTEQSMIMLLDDKGKLCINDFYCHACDIGSATEEPVKRYIELFRKERVSLLTFPDEKFGAEIDRMKECHPHIVEMVHELIEAVKSGDSIATDTINGMRRTKTYKAYPKSLGDENRLFMTISSYFERFRHRFEGKNGSQKFDEFTRLLKQDQV
jgi:hypothetical protein